MKKTKSKSYYKEQNNEGFLTGIIKRVNNSLSDEKYHS